MLSPDCKMVKVLISFDNLHCQFRHYDILATTKINEAGSRAPSTQYTNCETLVLAVVLFFKSKNL